MKLKVKKENEVALVTVQGSLDVSIQSELKEKLYDISKKEDHDIVIDFQEVSFIDSSCLGVLVGLTKKLREEKGDVKLSNLSDDVRSIFQITRLDRVFEIFDDNKTAIDSFFRS